MDIRKLKKEIEKNPLDAMAYYNLAKKLFSKPLDDLDSIEEVRNALNRAVYLSPNLFMAHFYLGRLHLLLKQYAEAEKEFREVLKIQPNSILAKEYLTKCLKVNEISEKPDKKTMSVRDFFFMFENEIRKFIEERLRSEYGENWLYHGVPNKIRGECAKRREEGLENERELQLLHFADFHDYREIIERNKVLFASIFDIKEWQKRLSELEPIRNALAHSRPISQEADKRIKSYYEEFMKVKVK